LEDHRKQLSEYLSQSDSDTNIIIDEIGVIIRNIDGDDLTKYFIDCLRLFPYKQLTVIGQSQFDFRYSLYL